MTAVMGEGHDDRLVDMGGNQDAEDLDSGY